MVKKPNFKLVAGEKDITAKIKSNLISLSFEDKEGFESDEMSFRVVGIYAKPAFGDKLELSLGWGEKLWLCGSFSVQTVTRDYKAQTTEVRATAVNFASPQKTKKRRSWENTSLFSVARAIAGENALKAKTTGTDMPIASELQDGVSDIEFIYSLCFKYGFKAFVKNNTLIITAFDAKGDETATSGTPKNEKLPTASVDLSELYSLEIVDANRNAYNSVVLEWQDANAGKVKSIKSGSGDKPYKMKIPQPKTDAEAYKIAEAKLNELQRGGVNGRLGSAGANIVAGGKLVITGVSECEGKTYEVKSVSHSLSASGYEISVEFEG